MFYRADWQFVRYTTLKQTNKMTDDSIITFGKYKGQKLANIPPEYLLWLYENSNVYGELKAYIADNLEVIKSEINYKAKTR